MSSIETTILVAAFAAAWHLTWFKSSLPCHVFKILKRLGWKKNADGFWPDLDEDGIWTRSEWSVWSSCKLNVFWAELLNCPWCLAWHASFWTTALFACLGTVPPDVPSLLLQAGAGVLACDLVTIMSTKS